MESHIINAYTSMNFEMFLYEHVMITWQLLGSVANSWDHSDPGYSSTSHFFRFSWQLLGPWVYKNYTLSKSINKIPGDFESI